MKTAYFRLALVGLILASGNAFGDATVIRTLKIAPHTQKGSIDARSVIQIRGIASRRETEVVAEGPIAQDYAFPRSTLALISLDTQQVNSKIFPSDSFVSVPLTQWASYLHEHTPRVPSSDDAPWHISQSWSRVVPEDETKTLSGFNCSKFTFEWHFEATNAEGYATKQYLVKSTLWLAELTPDLQQILAEEAEFQKGYRSHLKEIPLEGLNSVAMQFGEHLTHVDKVALFAGIAEGTTHLKKIVGYPMASQTEWLLVGSKGNKSLFTVTSELDSVSTASLAGSLFRSLQRSRSPRRLARL